MGFSLFSSIKVEFQFQLIEVDIINHQYYKENPPHWSREGLLVQTLLMEACGTTLL
jgi:hypothetical protein